ncbi:alpha/beta fold hydrolase BchO [Ciceribacter sp. L1K22]|uniref:alpha/beta fold hydrolase BchO n=1 Tax=Ciceribacter sp. L1K22 TaxID=2820275 RepID=UPI001ABDFCF7|nr:alpha/beta fold hydrolase BchO [Ciceribacter sp. L1K22]MBO3761764.1 alpha/beta fold hydrolase [Ciceribacter sp. L1K22]
MTISETWLDWERDGRDWPNHSASRFVEAAGFRWHVQMMGPTENPGLLLLHGTGASTHSWRHVLPRLAERYRVVAVDLPCHGFTRPYATADLSLPGMTRSLTALLTTLAFKPAAVIGHSAGAAIAVSLATTTRSDTQPTVVGINGAFLPIRGDRLFSPMAKLLFANPFSASMFSLLARSTPLGGNLLSATGSQIDAFGAALYRRLLASPGHVRGALGMMAAWDLTRFDGMLQELSAPATLIASRDDPMVPIRNSEHAAKIARNARLAISDHGGHLLHERDPGFVCQVILDAVEPRRCQGVDAA